MQNNSKQLIFSKIVTTDLHCVKSVRIWGYSGAHFPTFGLNTERYGLSFGIQSECWKMQTRITPSTDTSHAVLPGYFLKNL